MTYDPSREWAAKGFSRTEQRDHGEVDGQLELPLEWDSKTNDYAAAFVVLISHDGSVSIEPNVTKSFTVDRLATDNEIRHAARDIVEYFANRRCAAHLVTEIEAHTEAEVAKAVRKMLLKGSLDVLGR